MYTEELESLIWVILDGSVLDSEELLTRLLTVE
jgi:hypothetical protein